MPRRLAEDGHSETARMRALTQVVSPQPSKGPGGGYDPACDPRHQRSYRFFNARSPTIRDTFDFAANREPKSHQVTIIGNPTPGCRVS